MNVFHIQGILLRNLFLLKKSVHRIMVLFYWITLELFFWGFLTVWVSEIAAPDFKIDLALSFIGALIFWHMLYRAQEGVSLGLLEDIWTRNVINVFASPVKISEIVAGLALFSMIGGFLTLIFASALAWFLYSLEIWMLGFYIVPFFLGIFIFGWALGVATAGLIIRFGPSFDVLAFSIPFLFLPLSAVFYPLSVLPVFWQKVAFFLPTMHLFEGMRSIIVNGQLDMGRIFWALILGVVYLALSLMFFYWIIKIARKKGALGRLVTG